MEQIKSESFKNKIKLEDYSRLIELKQKYDRNEISESDLTEDEKIDLIDMYNNNKIQLNQKIAKMKADIAKMLKKF